MSFLSLKNTDITDNEDVFVQRRKLVCIIPRPVLLEIEYPIVWIDVHLSGDGYEICGRDNPRSFETRNNQQIIKILPGQSLRFSTEEKIGIRNDVTAIVMNSAGMATKGLSIAPGKIDPGFRPNRLTLVITNLSKKSIDLKSNDKIATLAFAQTSLPCPPSRSNGWGNRRIDGYTRSLFIRLIEEIHEVRFSTLLEKGLVPILAAILALLIKGYFEK